MSLFTSKREKKLWLWVVIVLIAIFSSLFLGRPLAGLISADQTIAVTFFWVSMFLVGTATLVHGLKKPTSNTTIMVFLGITAVYIMLLLRLTLAERSHMFEYSVLAIFIHEAFNERLKKTNRRLRAGLIAFLVTCLIGVIDECLQIIIPYRVFDPIDILFNSLATFMAIGSSLILSWTRRRFSKR